MKQWVKILFLFVVLLLSDVAIYAQCSICSKTASQMGEEAGRGLNGGILYLAAAPFLVLSYIGYKWWRNNQD
jgi:hypothetical protein